MLGEQALQVFCGVTGHPISLTGEKHWFPNRSGYAIQLLILGLCGFKLLSEHNWGDVEKNVYKYFCSSTHMDTETHVPLSLSHTH